MDLLSDVLASAGLARRMIHYREVPAPWASRFPCERSIGFHLVISGEVWLHVEQQQPIKLSAGDIALMARGVHHVLSTSDTLTESFPDSGSEVSQRRLSMVSGVYQLWHAPLHPLFRQLEDWTVVRSAELSGFEPLWLIVRLFTAEAASPGLATETICNGLLDVLFGFILRQVASGPSVEQNWGLAARDPQLQAALECIHRDFAKSWTLEELARVAKMSRTNFATRFKTSVGDSPGHYLLKHRMQQAMFRLDHSDESLEAIAAHVGYHDAFGFSKAFKKATGYSPSTFRKQARFDRALPVRFSENLLST